MKIARWIRAGFCRKTSRGILALVVFAGGASAAAGAAGTRVFRAGAATSNITPELGMQLRIGSFQSYPAKHVHDEMHARCLVLDDGTTRIAFVICDVLALGRDVVDEAKRLIEKETGLPGTNVITSATHTHSAMSARGYNALHIDQKLDPYQVFLARRMADGVRRAINNLTPAKIGWGRSELPGQVFNRRWFTKSEGDRRNPFGGIDGVRMNPPFASPHLIKPAGPVDPEILFFSVKAAADGRHLALLANYPLHYVGEVGPAGNVSADYFGFFADDIQRRLGADRLDPAFVGILTNGASGDINNYDVTKPRQKRKPYEGIRQVAGEVAAEVEKACRSLTYQEWVELKVAYRELPVATRKPSPELEKWARALLARPPSKSPYHERERFYAQRALDMKERADTTMFPLQAAKIGGLGIMTAPVETFVEIGLELKQRSTVKPLLFIGLANAYYGYLPTPRHHELGGYETWLSTNQVEVQASVKMVEALLQLQEVLR